MDVFARSRSAAGVALSEREREVLALIATGATNREIAAHLYLSPHTVKEHTSAIYRKLDVRNRAEAVKRAQRLGLIAALDHDARRSRSTPPTVAADPPAGGLRPREPYLAAAGGELIGQCANDAASLPRPGQPDRRHARARREAHRPELVELAIAERRRRPVRARRRGHRLAQPALFCASLAAWTRAGEPRRRAFAGHSLGELSALVAAGALDAEDGLASRWPRPADAGARRGELPGGMLALLGDGAEARQRAAATRADARQRQRARPARPLRFREALDAAAPRRSAHGGCKAIRLAVAGAFHSPAMARRASSRFAPRSSGLDVRPPRVAVFSSIAARPFDDDPAASCATRGRAHQAGALAGDAVDELDDAGRPRVPRGRPRQGPHAASSAAASTTSR